MRTIEHMAMFVVKYIHIQINSQFMDLSIVPGVDVASEITPGYPRMIEHWIDTFLQSLVHGQIDLYLSTVGLNYVL